MMGGMCMVGRDVCGGEGCVCTYGNCRVFF